ncbi:MAG: hypothetical protein K2X90_00010 [Candidatus Babeliaceae bacterium]|nr:hypothetical protein [Candidatus Babeliaceae bacterium]
MKKQFILLLLTLPTMCYIPSEKIDKLVKEFKTSDLNATPEVKRKKKFVEVLKSLVRPTSDYDNKKLSLGTVEYALLTNCKSITNQEMRTILDQMTLSRAYFLSSSAGDDGYSGNYSDQELLKEINELIGDRSYEKNCPDDACKLVRDWLQQQRELIIRHAEKTNAAAQETFNRAFNKKDS